MKQKLVALMTLGLLFTQTDGANAARNNRRAGSRSRSSSNVRVSGTTTTITATASDTTTVSSDYSKPAPITDAVAKRNCTRAVATGLKTYCGSKKCRNATEAFAGFTFPTTEKVGNNTLTETFCANFIEEAVNSLWDSYDSYAKEDEKVCNIAKARALAAESCYQYAVAEANNRGLKDNLTITSVFSEDDLDDFCGKEAVKKIYDQLPKKHSETSNDDTADVDFGTSLTRPFSRVGASGWANLMAYSRFLDLKFDTRSTEWPREIMQLVNSINTQGAIACGRDFAAQLKDTNFQLVDKSSSLEKRVNEKGLLAGGKDWIADQIGAIKGTNWANDFKAGKTKEERESAKTISEAQKNLKNLDKDYEAMKADIEKFKDNEKIKNANEERVSARKDIKNTSLKTDDIEKVNNLTVKQEDLKAAIEKAKEEAAKAQTNSKDPEPETADNNDKGATSDGSKGDEGGENPTAPETAKAEPETPDAGDAK